RHRVCGVSLVRRRGILGFVRRNTSSSGWDGHDESPDHPMASTARPFREGPVMHIRSRFSSVPVMRPGIGLGALAAPRFASAASPAWPQFGPAISTASSSQEHPAITTDGAGGAIVTWQDLRFPRVNIFARHVLGSGDLDPVWPVDGSALLTDSLALATADGGQF